MSKEETLKRIQALLSKAPKAERIQSIQATRNFKRTADAAKKAKSQDKAEQALR